MKKEVVFCERKTQIDRKIWCKPRLVVFGDVRELTRNTGTVGTGDLAYEGKKCKSAGNC